MSFALQQAIGHTVMDRAFCDQLVVDPEAAVKKIGVSLTTQELKELVLKVKNFKASVIVTQLDKLVRNNTSLVWGE